MADKPYKEDENKEYKPFDESEEVKYDFTEDGNGKKKLLSKFRAKPVLAVVVLIVVIGVIYKVIDVVKGDHKQSQTSVVTQQEKLPSIQKEAAAVSSKPVEKPVVVTPSNNKQVEENQQAIAKLQQMQRQTQEHLASVDQSVEQVGEQINAVATKIAELTQQVKTISVEKAKQQMSTEDLQKKQDAVTRAKLNYFVQAVIPGRAWLKSPAGQALTVAVGDNVKGYGKVLTIDSYSGTVTTSSGVTIPYGVSEK